VEIKGDGDWHKHYGVYEADPRRDRDAERDEREWMDRKVVLFDEVFDIPCPTGGNRLRGDVYSTAPQSLRFFARVQKRKANLKPCAP